MSHYLKTRLPHPFGIDEPNGDHLQQWERVTFAVVISIMAVTAVTGNTLVCLTLRRFKIPASAFLTNLAISDIVIGGLVMPCCVVTLLQKRWVFGPAMCDIIGFVKTTCIFSSVLTLCVISMDRYFFIKNVAYTTTVCKKVMGLLFPWIGPGLTATGPFLGWGIYKWSPCKSVCTVDWLHSPSFALFCFIFYGFVPQLFLLCCYMNIVRYVRQNKNRVNKSRALFSRMPQNIKIDHVNVDNGWVKISREELGVLKTMIVVVFVFAIMMVPYVIMQLISLRQNQEFSLRAETITTSLLFLGSCLNPLIYSGGNLKFRQALKKTVTGFFSC